MNVFTTGGAGYIGSVVTELLLDSGHNVVVFDNLSTGHRAAVDPRATFVCGDTADPAGVREAMRAAAPDVVVHMAAYIQMGESMHDPGKYFRNNAANTLNVLDAMLAANVPRIVFSSTGGVYGTGGSLPFGLDLPIARLYPYCECKRQVESIIQWYAQAHGTTATVFRFFNAAGATAKYGEDHKPESHLIPIVLQVAQGARPHLDLYGTDYATRDGTASRDYIHVRDLAQAHLLAVEQMGASLRNLSLDAASPGESGGPPEIHPHPRITYGAGSNPLPQGRGDTSPAEQGDAGVSSRGNDGASGVTIYNIGSEEGATNLEVIEMARRITGCPIPARECPRRPGDAAASLASAEKIRRELGWKPAYSDLETIISSAWDWEQRHPNGYGSVPSLSLGEG
ncbi:MAG: UDP-glucose 4-epimerase [Chloroflexota bacterium]|nr:UDP-glucose 4-epimerase [Chloroflexota bacterium]